MDLLFGSTHGSGQGMCRDPQWLASSIGPEDHINMRMLHSGSKAQDKGESRGPSFVVSSCLGGVLSPTENSQAVHSEVRGKAEDSPTALIYRPLTPTSP